MTLRRHHLLKRLALPALVFFLSLAPRIAYLVELHANSPTFEHPEGGDSIFYDRVASGEPEPARAYFHSPLYRWFLTGVYRTVGRNLLVVRLLQHLLGAVTAVLVFLIAMRLFASPPIAVTAALLQSWFGPGIFYEGHLLVDALLPLLCSGAALALVHLVERPSLRLGVLAGAAVGLFALGRATALVWLVFSVAWLVVRCRSWRAALGLALGAAALIAPVTVRNYAVERDFVLITANGGLNLFIGNNPHAQGAYNLPEGLWFRPGDPKDDFSGVKVSQTVLGRRLKSSALSAWWRSRALAYATAHPRRTLELLAHKAALLVNHYEQPQLYHFYAYQELSGALRLLPGAGLAMALGLLGFALAMLAAARSSIRFYGLLTLLYGAAFLPFFVVGRYRAPLATLLAPLAAWALVTLLHAAQTRRWRWFLPLGSGLLVAALLCYLPVGQRPRPTYQYLAFGQAALQHGSPAVAARWFEKAVAVEPGAVTPAALLVQAQVRAGRLGEARLGLARAERRWPNHAAVHLSAGLLHLRSGNLTAAERSLRRTLDLDPGAAEAWRHLGQVLALTGRPREAAEAYQSARALASPGASDLPVPRKIPSSP